MQALPHLASDIMTWAYQFPWYQDLAEVHQDPQWHAEGDVPDTRLGYLLTLSAVMHDIGKIKTTETNEDGRIVAPRHAIVGSRMAQGILRKLLSPKKRTLVCELIRLHGRPLHAWDNPVLSAIMSQTVPLNLLQALVQADITGRHCTEAGTDRFELWKAQIADWPQPYAFPNEHVGYQAFQNKLDILPTEGFQPVWKSEVIFLSGPLVQVRTPTTVNTSPIYLCSV